VIFKINHEKKKDAHITYFLVGLGVSDRDQKIPFFFFVDDESGRTQR